MTKPLPFVSRPPALGRFLLMGWAVCGAVATLLLLGAEAQAVVQNTMVGEGTPLKPGRLRWPAIYWYGWAGLGPFIARLAWRYPVIGPRRWHHLAALGAGAPVFYALHVAWQLAWMALPHYAGAHPDWTDAVRSHLSISSATNVAVYVLVIAATHGLMLNRRVREREVRAAQLEADLADARLRTLEARLHPHFLFNALNAVAALMHRDVEAADDVLTRLGDLLRTALDRSGQAEVPLREEVAFVRSYLQIEQARLGDRLRPLVEIPPEAGGALVPSLLLQPLVENAVRHGAAQQTEPCHVTVRAWREGGTLRLQVQDDGPGLRAPSLAAGTGLGLSTTRDRLHQLYGDRQSLAVLPREPRGVTVDVEIPFRTEPPPAEPAPAGAR